MHLLSAQLYFLIPAHLSAARARFGGRRPVGNVCCREPLSRETGELQLFHFDLSSHSLSNVVWATALASGMSEDGMCWYQRGDGVR